MKCIAREDEGSFVRLQWWRDVLGLGEMNAQESHIQTFLNGGMMTMYNLVRDLIAIER